MKKTLMLALALCAGTSLAAPFVYPAAWSADPPSAAKRGGEFRDSTFSDFKTLNPFVSKETPNLPAYFASGAFLYLQNPVDDEFIPKMAESMPVVSNNNKRFVVKIRKGMKFSDGQEITADDWVSTYKIHMDPKVNSNRRPSFLIGDKVITVKKLDNYTLQFDFPAPLATAFLKMSFVPWPDHVFGKAYREGGATAVTQLWGLSTPPKNIVTPGAWKLGSYSAGQRTVLVRNDMYGEWNKDSAGKPVPYLDSYSFRVLENQTAQMAAFLAGQMDTYAPRGADDLAQIKRAIDAGNLKAEVVPNAFGTVSSTWIVFNWNQPSAPFKQKLFRDVRFRKAMSHLVNREAMVQLALGGLGRPTYSPITSEYKAYYNLNDSLPKYPYNLEAASKLLAQMGFKTKDKDGWLVDSKGNRVEFTLNTNSGNTVREQLGSIFRDEAKKVGVKVNFVPIDFNVLVNQLSEFSDDRKWDSIMIGFGGANALWPFNNNIYPCGTTYHVWYKPKAGGCLVSQEQLLTKLFYQGEQELNTAKRKAIGAQLMKAEAELQPLTYLVSGNDHIADTTRLGGEYPRKLWSGMYGNRRLTLTYIK